MLPEICSSKTGKKQQKLQETAGSRESAETAVQQAVYVAARKKETFHLPPAARFGRKKWLKIGQQQQQNDAKNEQKLQQGSIHANGCKLQQFFAKNSSQNSSISAEKMVENCTNAARASSSKLQQKTTQNSSKKQQKQQKNRTCFATPVEAFPPARRLQNPKPFGRNDEQPKGKRLIGPEFAETRRRDMEEQTKDEAL
ncbi:UNVERIFIED_CONTAM: hypothetical protein Sindi_2637900 [Sesamum indicum]